MKRQAWAGMLLLAWTVLSSPAAAGDEDGNEPVLPLPDIPEVDPQKRDLGERLFFEPLLSEDGKVSCASCHDLSDNGAGREALTAARPGDRPQFNTPTVFNAALNAFFFWDGRAGSLEEQIDSVVKGEPEFNTRWPRIVERLQANEDYRTAFRKIYRDGITPANIKDAIATFERTLLTPGSRFDRYLRGERDALTEEEKQGYQLFKSYGCSACHQGVNLGGNLFQKLGIFEDFFKDRPSVSRADLGRFNVTGRDQDRHVFRVPSLRNVAVTAPYFHDGSVATLEEAVAIVARYQLGRRIGKQEVKRIVAFLRTLTGTFEGRPLDGNAHGERPQ